VKMNWWTVGYLTTLCELNDVITSAESERNEEQVIVDY
jgi:hypothetical protein